MILAGDKCGAETFQRRIFYDMEISMGAEEATMIIMVLLVVAIAAIVGAGD